MTVTVASSSRLVRPVYQHCIVYQQINYFWGFLHVHLESAELYGKRSQAPFALVYLLGSNGLGKFQIENNGTKTHDKNIKPEMHHDFFFKVKF